MDVANKPDAAAAVVSAASTPKELSRELFSAPEENSPESTEEKFLATTRKAVLFGVGTVGADADIELIKEAISRQGDYLKVGGELTDEELEQFREIVSSLSKEGLEVYLTAYGVFAVREAGRSVLSDNPDITPEDLVAEIRKKIAEDSDLAPNEAARTRAINALEDLDPTTLLAELKDLPSDAISSGTLPLSIEDQMKLLVGFYLRDKEIIPDDIAVVRKDLEEIVLALPGEVNAAGQEAIISAIGELELSDVKNLWEQYAIDIISDFLLYYAPKLKDQPEQLLPSIKDALKKALDDNTITAHEHDTAVLLLDNIDIQTLFTYAGMPDEYQNFVVPTTDPAPADDPADQEAPSDQEEDASNWLIAGLIHRLARAESPPQSQNEFREQASALVAELDGLDEAEKAALKSEIDGLSLGAVDKYLLTARVDFDNDKVLQQLLPALLASREEFPSPEELVALYSDFIKNFRLSGALTEEKATELEDLISLINPENASGIVDDVVLAILSNVFAFNEQQGLGFAPDAAIEQIEEAILGGQISQSFGQVLIDRITSLDADSLRALVVDYQPRSDRQILDPNASVEAETASTETEEPAEQPAPEQSQSTEPPADPPAAQEAPNQPSAIAQQLVDDPIFRQLIENRKQLIATQEASLKIANMIGRDNETETLMQALGTQSDLHVEQLEELDAFHEKLLPGYTEALQLYSSMKNPKHVDLPSETQSSPNEGDRDLQEFEDSDIKTIFRR